VKFGVKFQNALPRWSGELRELPAARPSTPFHPLYLVVRWLAPWAVALAISTVIAHTADALFAPSNHVEFVASDQARRMHEQTLVPLEPEAILTRVHCTADADTAERDVLLTSLQDLRMLEEGECTMRS